MATRFAPGEDGEYLLIKRPRRDAARDRPHSPHDADAYEQYGHDLDRVCQAIKPLLDTAPPGPLQRRPRGARGAGRARLAGSAASTSVLHNAVRLLTGSAADFLDDYFESPTAQGLPGLVGDHRLQGRPALAGERLVLLFHSLGEHDGEFGSWAFHKGGNGGFTQVLARAAEAFGAEIRLEAPVERVITRDGEATGVALADGTEIAADVVVSALDPRRTFLELVDPRELPDDLVEDIRRMKFQGVSSKVNFALDGLPAHPVLGARGTSTAAS
jgi:phytoene dehydrogenase-like protein